MMVDSYGRGASAGLRGRLSEVYFPALVSSQTVQLASRLGERATVDDPLFGRVTGMPELTERLDAIARWLAEREAVFETFGFVVGSDRDVTEGSLALTIKGARVLVPVATVAEKRREREVELRTYYSTRKLGDAAPTERDRLPNDGEIVVPPPVAAHLEALARGDVDAVVASFEHGGTVRSADGETHAKLDGGGPLHSYYVKLLGAAGAERGMELIKNGRADDGSTCALEFTMVRRLGREVPPRPGLAVYERGQSGLLRTVRMYEDL